MKKPNDLFPISICSNGKIYPYEVYDMLIARYCALWNKDIDRRIAAGEVIKPPYPIIPLRRATYSHNWYICKGVNGSTEFDKKLDSILEEWCNQKNAEWEEWLHKKLKWSLLRDSENPKMSGVTISGRELTETEWDRMCISRCKRMRSEKLAISKYRRQNPQPTLLEIWNRNRGLKE